MVALGKIVFTSREHIIALEPCGKGMVGVTLRYPYEVRDPAKYFDEISDEKVPKDMLELAVHIVDTKRGEFEPQKFEDEYENAVKELLRKKQAGQKIERPKEPARTNVVNLMDALRQSLAEERGGGGRPSPSRAPAKKGKMRVEGQREMLLPIPGSKRQGRSPAAAKTARHRKTG